MNTVCLHIGTHKTGTKTIQVFLAANEQLFASAGVYVPQAGRHEFPNASRTPGHHEIAWDFAKGDESPHFQAAREELKRVQVPLVVFSSEELHPLYIYPDRLKTIVDGFASIGYQTKILVYLREQARYAESLYAEYSKQIMVGSFDNYLNGILTKGTYTAPLRGGTTIAFEYTRILRAFAQAAGAENVIARVYRTDQGTDFLLRDFLTVLATLRGGLNLQGLENPIPLANPSQSLRELLAKIYRVALLEDDEIAPIPQEYFETRIPGVDERLFGSRFLLITREEILRVLERFQEDNLRVRDEFGCTLPFLSEADIPPLGIQLWDDTRLQRRILAAAVAYWGINED